MVTKEVCRIHLQQPTVFLVLTIEVEALKTGVEVAIITVKIDTKRVLETGNLIFSVF